MARAKELAQGPVNKVHLFLTLLLHMVNISGLGVLLAVHVCVLQLYISMTHSPPSAAGSLGLW